MKILFFCLKFPLASETFVLNQINYFISLGHDVKVLSLYPGDMKNVHEDYYKFDLSRRVNYIFENEYNKRSLTFYSRARLILSNVFKFNLKSFNFKKYGFFVCSLLLPSIVSKLKNRMSSDVIVAHFGHSGALANYLRDVGVISGQLVTVFHGYDLSAETLLKKYNFAYKDLFLSGDLFLPISEKWKDKLIEMQCPPDKIHIIRMGIKVKHFEYNERSFSAEPIKIISVCRLIEKKGLEYAIVACANLKKLGYKFSYQIIGYGELHEQLSLLINKLDLQDSVSILGFQPQSVVREMLNDSHVFLLPSVTAQNGDMEGIPVALMEAMASGLPVVSTYHSGIPELIENEVTGWLCPERDAQSITDVLVKIINQEFEVVQIERNARMVIVNEFNEETEYNKMSSLLERL